MRITNQQVSSALRRAAEIGKEQWLRESIAVRGAGRWEVRATPSGKAHSYWRGQLRGRREVFPLGTIGTECSVAEARAKAHDIGIKLRSGGLRAAESARPITTVRGSGGTLAGLLEEYARRLEGAGKRRSAQDVRSIVRTHIQPHRLAQANATSVEPEELVQLIRPVVEAGKLRAADKLRGFLISAYKAAVSARFDPSASPALAALEIRANPAAVIPAIKSGKGRAGHRHLNESDLRAFLPELLAQTSLGAQAMVLALFLGGQRALQTARTRLADVNGDIRLLDPKGRREQPREHWLPLVGRAKAIVVARMEAARSVGDEFLFESVDSRTGKRAHVRSETMNDAVKAARDAATAKGHRWSEAAEGFTLGDLRRTAETQLARLGVSKDDRAQLLSHGLGGVQSRHYDRHEYMDEKRAALNKWSKHLEALA